MTSRRLRINRRRILRPACAGLLALAALQALPAAARDGRDYAGSYQIAEVSRQDGDATVAIRLSFVNYGDQALDQATVAIKDPLNPRDDFGSFGGTVSAAVRAPVQLSGSFVVPQSESDAWQRGMPPRFVVVQTVGGQRVERPIEVLRTGGRP